MFIGFVTDGEADFVQNFIPMSEVWTNIGTGWGRTSSKTLYQNLKYGRMSLQRATCVAQKNSRIDYPTLYFFGEKI